MARDIDKTKKIYKKTNNLETKNKYGNTLKLFYAEALAQNKYLETSVARKKIEELNLTTDIPLEINDQILVTLSDVVPMPSTHEFYLINIDTNNIRYENGVRINGYDKWKIYIDLTSDNFIPDDTYLNISRTGKKFPKGCTQKIVKKSYKLDTTIDSNQQFWYLKEYLPPFSELSLLKNEKQFHLCKNDRENPTNDVKIAPINLLTRVIEINPKNKDIVLGLSSYYKTAE